MQFKKKNSIRRLLHQWRNKPTDAHTQRTYMGTPKNQQLPYRFSFLLSNFEGFLASYSEQMILIRKSGTTLFKKANVRIAQYVE